MAKYIPSGPKATEMASDIQPWGLEFLRFDQLLKAADDLAIQVRMYETREIRHYWVILYQLFMMMKPYMAEGSEWYFQGLNKETKEMISNWEEDEEQGVHETPKELIDKLTSYHQAILKSKHFLGLGIPMSQKFNTKTKMKNALLGKTGED